MTPKPTTTNWKKCLFPIISCGPIKKSTGKSALSEKLHENTILMISNLRVPSNKHSQ